MNRRKFLQTAAVSTTGVLTAASTASAWYPTFARVGATPEQVAEFNRPIKIFRGPYITPPDMKHQPGVPRGTVFTFQMNHSQYFPGPPHHSS